MGTDRQSCAEGMGDCSVESPKSRLVVYCGGAEQGPGVKQG